MKIQKCVTCGWPYPNYHVCQDLDEVRLRDRMALNQITARPKGKRVMSQEHKDRIAEAQRARHAKRKAEKNEREALHWKAVELYAQGDMGAKAVAAETGLHYTRVLKILKQAEADGFIVMRKRGATIAKGALL